MAFSPVAVSSDASPEPGGGGRLGEEADGERRGRLKETAGSSLASLCLGPLAGPRRFGTLVECLVLNYRLRQGPGRGRERGAEGAADGPLRCCGCGRTALRAPTLLRTWRPSARCWRALCGRGCDVRSTGGGGNGEGGSVCVVEAPSFAFVL